MAVSLADSVASSREVPDVSRGPPLMRIIWAMLALSILVVALRFYAKISTARKLYVDDWLMGAALAFAIVHASFLQVAVNSGFGRHTWYIPLATLSTAMEFSTLSFFWGFLSPCLGRVSFCYTLIFLAHTDAKFKSWPMYACIALQLAINSMGTIVFYTQCGFDLDTFWTPEKLVRYREYCQGPEIQAAFSYFIGAYNTLTDGLLAFLPALLVHRTSMSLKRKLGVALLLCLSTLAMISSGFNTYQVKSLTQVSDTTYNLAPFLSSLVVELNVVIIAASIPFLRPLFRGRRRLLRRLGSSHHHHHLPLGQVSSSSHYPLSSGVSSKNHSRTNTAEEEDLSIVSPTMVEEGSTTSSSAWGVARASEFQGAITVTTEVSVSYEKMGAPELHAALVGLSQGEMANPRLVQR